MNETTTNQHRQEEQTVPKPPKGSENITKTVATILIYLLGSCFSRSFLCRIRRSLLTAINWCFANICLIGQNKEFEKPGLSSL